MRVFVVLEELYNWPCGQVHVLAGVRKEGVDIEGHGVPSIVPVTVFDVVLLVFSLDLSSRQDL